MIPPTYRAISKRLRDEAGVNLVEYCILVSLIVLVCYIAVVVFGEEISVRFSEAHDLFPD